MIGFNPAFNIDYFGHLGGLIAGGVFRLWLGQNGSCNGLSFNRN